MGMLLRRVGAKDLLIAALGGATVGVSPFTPNELAPSLVAGILTGGALLGYRIMSQVSPADAASTDAPPRESPLVPPSVAVAFALYLAVIGPTVMWVFELWTSSIWLNGHGIFIPWLCAYLGLAALRGDPDTSSDSSAWGFAFFVPGLLLIVADSGIGSGYLAVVGLLLTFPGLTLLLLGARRTQRLAVPLTASLLMFPVPNILASHLYLRQITAWGVHPFLEELGMAVYRENTVIHTAKYAFVVTDACSGFATLYASVATAAILACYCRTHSRRILVVLAAVPLALVANIVRVSLLVVITNWLGSDILETPVHEASGVATFVVVLFGLFTLAGQTQLKREAT